MITSAVVGFYRSQKFAAKYRKSTIFYSGYYRHEVRRKPPGPNAFLSRVPPSTFIIRLILVCFLQCSLAVLVNTNI